MYRILELKREHIKLHYSKNYYFFKACLNLSAIQIIVKYRINMFQILQICTEK